MFKVKKEKKTKLPIGRILSNNIFIIKLIHNAAPGVFIGNALFQAFYALADFVFYTLMLRYIINGISSNMDFAHLVTVLLVWLIIQVSIHFITEVYYQKYYAVKMNEVLRSIHTMTYKKASEVELGCYENPEYYDKFVKAIDECQNRTWEIINAVNMLVYRAVKFVCDFTLLTIIDPILLLFVILPVFATPLKAKFNRLSYGRTMETKEVNRRRDYSQRVFYLADYAKEMRLTNMPSLMIKMFREAADTNIGLLKSYGWKIAFVGFISVFVSAILTPLGATAYVVFKTLGLGTMKFGDCIVVVNSIDSLSYTLTNSADVLMKFQENALFIENLREFLSYEPKIVSGDKTLPYKGDLVLNNVSFKYEGAKDYTLKNVSMSIGENEKIAIVGHNGAGKTTLVKLLLRLYDCEGDITYGGTDIKELNIDEYRNSFAVVMQDFHVFALSVFDNVMLIKHDEANRKKVNAALNKSGLNTKIEKFSKKEDTVMTREFDDEGELLSGGEQQKLAISHVYSKENRFVVLDEPSSALDPIAEYEMYECMNNACENCGMIFISHRLSSAVMADRIYLMEDGTIAEQGTHKELMEKNGKYAAMFRRQAENYAEVEI